MIYGHVEQWKQDENPSFARAVAEFYSLREGQTNSAAVGEVRYWRLAWELVSRVSSDDMWTRDDGAFYGPLLARIERETRKMREAVRSGDWRHLTKLAACVRLLDRQQIKGSSDPLKAVEYVFEAYYFLRKRGGKGSRLPTKREVRNCAALIEAFHIERLNSKLPGFLWYNRGLTEREFGRVERLRKLWMDRSYDRIWTDRLEKAACPI
jgi:hypothetical protein